MKSSSNAKNAEIHLQYQVLVLGGTRYAVLPESTLSRLCARAGVESGPVDQEAGSLAPDPYDRRVLAERIAGRRQAAGLTQSELASRAGIRVETLNRIERGKTTPDFSTIRKLVSAIQKAEPKMKAKHLP